MNNYILKKRFISTQISSSFLIPATLLPLVTHTIRQSRSNMKKA